MAREQNSHQEGPPQGPVSEEELAALGQALHVSLSSLVSAAGSPSPRPTEFARGWGVDQTLAIRVCAALRSHDPLAVIHGLPAPGGLRLLLAAARKKDVPEVRLGAFEQTIVGLEGLITRVGGKKSNLDTLIGGQLLEVRARSEHASKQKLNRGISDLLGLQAETSLVSYFVYPSDEGDTCDELAIYGVDKLRRLRSDLPILLGGRNLAHEGTEHTLSLARETLLRDELPTDGFTTALQRFCTDPMPGIDVSLTNDQLLYTLPAGADLGELSLFFASIDSEATTQFRTAEQRAAEHRFVPRNPAKNMLLDVFVHREVWRGEEPTLVIARSAAARAHDRESGHVDLLDMIETVQPLGTGVNAVRTKLLPRYMEMLESIHSRMGWDPDTFRLYRCHVKYPVVGLWYSLEFSLPEKPSCL